MDGGAFPRPLVALGAACRHETYRNRPQPWRLWHTLAFGDCLHRLSKPSGSSSPALKTRVSKTFGFVVPSML